MRSFTKGENTLRSFFGMGGIYPENSSQLVQICSLDSRAKGLMGSHAAVSAMLQCTSNPKEMDTPFNLC